LAVLVLLAGCGQQQPATEQIIRPVRYARVYATGPERVRTFSGTAQAGLESQLSFKVAGTIARLAVRVGESVRSGDLIAALDDNDYRLQVQEAAAALAQAQAQQRNAKNSYERVQALYENGTASKQDLDAARAGFESAAAQVVSIQKRLELANLQVEYCRLGAPFDGKVAEVRVDESENVGAGQPVVLLTAEGRPEVAVAVPEVLIAQIDEGSGATVTFDALPGMPLPAVVTEVGVASTGFATTFPVTVRLQQQAPEVRPGMAAEVAFRFETAGAQEAMIVPAVAVGEDRRGRFVFVIEPAGDELGIARRREVRVGALTAEGLEILAGLQEGELVVTAGVSRISDGQKVKLL
jgi:RND family efflux transporter MFP subunit